MDAGTRSTLIAAAGAVTVALLGFVRFLIVRADRRRQLAALERAELERRNSEDRERRELEECRIANEEAARRGEQEAEAMDRWMHHGTGRKT